jgi:hypothetical protein
MDTGVCIGGPWDGKRYRSQHNDFIVHAAPQMPYAICSEYLPAIVDIKMVRYRRELFRGASKDFIMWIPDGQTVEQTVERLLEVYTEVIAAKPDVHRSVA